MSIGEGGNEIKVSLLGAKGKELRVCFRCIVGTRLTKEVLIANCVFTFQVCEVFITMLVATKHDEDTDGSATVCQWIFGRIHAELTGVESCSHAIAKNQWAEVCIMANDLVDFATGVGECFELTLEMGLLAFRRSVLKKG